MSPEKKFYLICDEEDCRIDVYLSKKLSITRTKVKDLIKEGHVRIAGALPKSSTKLKRFSQIDGEIPEEEPLTLEPQDIPLDILYEDEFFLALNKPDGMVVHPSFGHHTGTLVNAVLAYLERQRSGFRGTEDRGQKTEDKGWRLEVRGRVKEGENDGNAQFAHNSYFSFRPGIVHRLDKDTTGVILVAKDSKTQEMLSTLFKERSVRKTYRAVVEETIIKSGLVIEGNIGRHPIDRKRMAVLKDGGRVAYTEVKVIERLDGFTYVEAYPKTGRTHQIRVHLAHIGHPIVGDVVYGRRARLLVKRPLLHAYRIEFIHPVIKTPLLIEAPIPEDLEVFVKGNKKDRRQKAED